MPHQLNVEPCTHRRRWILGFPTSIHRRITLVACLIALAGVGSALIVRRNQPRAITSVRARANSKQAARVKNSYGSLPLSFEENQGQTNAAVKFLARGAGYSLFLTPSEAVLSLNTASRAKGTNENETISGKTTRETVSNDSSRAVLRMKLLGASPNPSIAGVDKLPGKANYFIGKESKNWNTGISTFERVKYRHIYPGIDLSYYGNQGQLEYDFIVEPGRDPKQIAIGVEGAHGVSIDNAGDLIIKVGDREVRQHKPFAYQETNGTKHEIASGYELTAANQIGFWLGEYDTTKPLVIDPVLVYSTYFGGSGFDMANGIAVNSSGEAYITGSTASLNFPASPVQKAALDVSDAFVVKLNAAGTSLVYASYFGGDNRDFANAIAVDPSGNAYVAGSTHSFNFPTAGSPFQSAKAGGNPLFKSTDGGANFGAGVASGNATGLTASNISAIAVHPTNPSIVFATPFTGAPVYKSTDGGATWIASGTGVPDDFMNDITFNRANPTIMYAAAVSNSLAGGIGGLYRSIDAGANWSLVSGPTSLNTVISDPSGVIYVGGFDGRGVWKSSDGTTWNNFVVGDLEADGGTDGFGYAVTNIVVDPSNLQTVYAGTDGGGIWKSLDGGATWTRMLNAPGYVSDHSLAIDASNTQILFAVINGQLQKSTNAGTSWSVVPTTVSAGSYPTSTLIANSTVYVGTTQNGVIRSTDGGANWSATSLTTNDIHGLVAAPSASNEIYAEVLSGSDGFVTKFSPNGSSLTYSTYLGGGIAGSQFTAEDNLLAIALDTSGNAYVTGSTSAANFPIQGGAQTSSAGFVDAVVAKLSANGSSLLFSTYLGGGANEAGRGIAVSPSGSIYITGNTASGNFPIANAAQPTFGGGNDAFIVKYDPSGGAYTTAFSTFLGGVGNDQGKGIAVDASGNAYVTGQTNTGGLATAGAAQTTKGLQFDGFLAKFDSSGIKSYFTYVGGTGAAAGESSRDIATGVAVDSAGNAYVTGYTRSNGFPVSGSLKTFNTTSCDGVPCYEAFVTKINPTGSARVFSTLLGGDGSDQGLGIALDSNGGVYVAGITTSLEAKAGAVQTTNGGGTDAFITKLGPITDLSVAMTDNPDPVSINNNITYTATITNGEANVTGVTLTDILPANTSYISASASQGTCSGTTTITCNIGSMAAGATVTVTIVLSPSVEGSISNRVDVASTETDTNPVNNFATQSTRVTVGAVYTVNSNADTNDGACTASGTGNGCTLREAITAANANVGKDTIAFNIAGGGAQTINTTSILPNVSEAVFIDGSSQPGFAGALLIELKGSSAGQTSGLNISGGNSRIKALAVNGFFYSGISLQGSNNVIEGCFIGTNLSGTAAVPNTTGISVDSGSNNLIGGTTVAARNVISGNNGNGISVNAGASGTRIKGNYIGPRNDGIGALTQPNWAPGIGLYSTSGNIVGGTEPGAGNVISGNKGPGVFISMSYPSGPGSTNNTVQGNYLGTYPDGLNALINEGGALSIGDGSSNNLIGGTVPSARNVMAPGMSIYASNANTIQGNYIGIKADGSARITTAGFSGIQMRGGSNNIIGGTAPGAGNVISGNNGPGIWIVNSCTECNPPQPQVLSTNNVVQGNIIGLNPTGTAAVPNTGNGVEVSRGSTGNLIGGTTAGARNIISGNTGSGVVINNFSGASNGNTIQGNFIGTNPAGTAAIGNTGNGISINGVDNTTIGGITAGAGNLVSGNLSSGIVIGSNSPGSGQPQVGSNGAQVLGNFIGTNATGTAVVRNTFSGISVNASSNIHIGGTAAGSRNLISGNGGNGVDINVNSNGNFVEGNYVGTDITGMSALVTTVNGAPFYGNGSGVGIVGGSNNKIGGTTAAERNVISGNSCQGVPINNALVNSVIVQASNNTVQGNYIGLNKDGTALVNDPNGGAAFGNKCSGVFISGAIGNLIGGTSPGAGNVIGGSAHQGVVVSNGNGVVGSSNTIQGNIIGSNVAMTLALPNGIGVFLFNGSFNNVVGGDDDDDGSLDGVVNAGNKIFGSTGDGIQVQSSFVSGAGGGTLISSNNKIQGNLIGGSTILRNANNGVNVNGAMNNVVGGATPGAGNTISFNNNNGIVVNCPVLNGVVTCGVGNTLSRNSIFSHVNNLGIRLNANGASTGNNNQAAPVISFVSVTGSGTVVQGSLTTNAANQNYTLEFFANDSCGNSSQGEGKTYIGTYNVTTDGSGTVSFTTPALDAVAPGKIITGTATHATNGTSRFSTCAISSNATATISGRTTDQNGTPLAGATITLSGGQSATATTDAQGNYSFPNLPSNVSYTVTASLSGVTFYPASFTLTNLPADRTVNFTKAVARYTITDLGALTAGPQSFGWDVNSSGQATGWSNSGPPTNTNYRPYLYSNGSITNLTPLGTGTNALAIAMNDSARIVGYSELAPQAAGGAFSGQIHGFFSDNGGVLKDIGTFGGASSQAWGVNDNGVVVGQAQNSNNLSRPFVWRDLNNDGLWQLNEMIDVGWINGGVNGRLFAINNNNVAVGNNIDGATGFQTATLWKDDNANGVSDPGELRLLGTLGGSTSFAQGINDSGYVSGVTDIAAFASNGRQMQRAFIWHDDNNNGVSDPGEMKSLGTLGGEFSAALRINASNEVVGWSDAVGLNTFHAIRWKNNFMLDLNAAIPQNSGWLLQESRGINDNGKITGYGTINGVQHAYLLTPSLSPQTVTFDAIANKTYGNAPFTVSATASSNLPVTFSVVSGPASVNGNTVTITGAGQVTLRATQLGDDTYDSASADQTFTVAPALLRVIADSKTKVFGAPNPIFTVHYSGFVNGDGAGSLGGTLSFSSAADNSPVGTYSITPSGYTSANYTLQYLSATLTIDQASTSTYSANYNLPVPGSVNLVAQVTGDAPSTLAVDGGTVMFVIRQGATTVGSVTTGAVTNGSAGAAFNAPAAGAYTVYASYSGSTNYFGSTGLASLTVGNANPIPAITGVTPDSAVKKPTETGQFTLLIDGNGFISTTNGDPANSTVDWYDRTTGQHTNLAITSTTASQIQAVIPYTLIRDGKTVEVTVINPGPGGGASNVQPFFVTDTTATVTSADTVIPDPVTGNASTTSVTPTGAILSAEASSGGAGGSGTLTVAQYSADPIGTNSSPNTSAFSTAEGSGYFDVYVSPGSSFTSLTLDYCNTGGTTLYWWNGSVWGLVSNQTYNPTTGCITVTVTTSSSPSIDQLTGTVFGVASGPAINSITVSPAATIALGSAINLNAAITDASGGGPYTAEISWGDNQTSTLNNVSGPTLSATHSYAAAGSYSISVKVSRGESFGTSTFSPLVVFNPNAGSMNAAGWFNSPLGSYPANPGFAGKLYFETNVQYQTGAIVPTGTAKVNLPGKDFVATSMSWLTINGSNVQISGAGTINNAPGYNFLLTGIDGKLDGKKLPDKVRVKIWNQTTGAIVYDSQVEAADNVAPAIVLGGGTVNIKR